jgi:ribosomal protein S1
VLAIAGVLLISQLLASPHFVPRVTFENPTPYELTVEVSNGHDGWLPVGSMDAHRKTDVGEVYDIGDVWNVRVFTQGESVGRFRLTRDELERSHWRVQIPQRIGDDLQAAGVEHQP